MSKGWLLLIVVALGCATRHDEATCVSGCPPRTIARERPRPAVEVADPRYPRTETGGVSLTGPELPYTQRVDNSGWTGVSPPGSVGGGPSEDAASEE